MKRKSPQSKVAGRGNRAIARVAVYVRVSTVGQNTEGQIAELSRWLKGHRIDDPRWFIDHASGDNFSRPKFDELQSAIFNAEIDTIVVWKLDRLSRNLRDGISVLADWCDRGLRVVSVTQQIDFNGALGKMLAAVLLGVAEMEQETRRERQAAGIAAARQRGVYFGRKRGTTKAKPKRALELRAKGLNDAEIGKALGISRRSVQRYLRQAERN